MSISWERDFLPSFMMLINDPIAKYVLDTPNPWGEVTIRHLLTHTSGIACYLNDLPADDTSQDLTAAELLERVRDLPLKFKAGSDFA